MDFACGREVGECKKLRNGTLLVRTKSSLQDSRLMQLKAFAPNFSVVVRLHNALNYTKGVIYSNDLRTVVGSVLSSEHREVFCPSSARSRITYMFVCNFGALFCCCGRGSQCKAEKRQASARRAPNLRCLLHLH